MPVTKAAVQLLIVSLLPACGHAKTSALQPPPHSSAASAALVPAKYPRISATQLFEACASGAADAGALDPGARYTINGNVVSVKTDAGPAQVVLGSRLTPVDVTGIAPAALATLVVGSSIELDCVVLGSAMQIPSLDCGPNGTPRVQASAR